MKIKIFLFMSLLAMLIIPSLPAADSDGSRKLKSGIITLRNALVEADILPCPGGRLIAFRKIGGKNILLFPPELLEETESMVPATDALNPSGKVYYGFEAWLAPQSEWWMHQELNPAKKKSHSPWPPDPYHAYGRYHVTDKTDQSVTLESPDSPVTGIRFVKQYTILADGSLKIRITAINIRQEPLPWSIWTNTRLNGEANPYASMKILPDGSSPVICKFFTGDPAHEIILPFKVRDNFFTFDTSSGLPDKKLSRSNKAFILSSDGIIAAFHKNLLLVKTLQTGERGPVHYEHARAEIYQLIPSSGQALLELEFCGNSSMIKPGEAITLEENWKLIDYPGGDSIEEHTAFLKKMLYQ